MSQQLGKQKLAGIQTEVDAAFLYQQIAKAESDPAIAAIFQNLAAIESGHAAKMLEQLQKRVPDAALPPPSWRARTLDRIGKIFGYDYIIGVMMDTEKSISQALVRNKKKPAASRFPERRATTLKSCNRCSETSTRFRASNCRASKGGTKQSGGNALRAAVLGANDGLVSNLSLVMGVAGATSGQSEILLAGSAGLWPEHFLWPWANGFR
jgi:rubrerythrin